MSYNAWFQCINPACKERYPLTTIIYRCKNCNSLLEVQHDMQALAHRSAKAWMKLFEDRYKSTEWPYGSGIWGKKEWVLPEIDPLQCFEGYYASCWQGGLSSVYGRWSRC